MGKSKTVTKAPTGLTITRSGTSFTFKWKIGDSDYGNGQQLLYQVDGGKQKSQAIGKTDTSVTLNLGNISQCAFWVRGKRRRLCSVQGNDRSRVRPVGKGMLKGDRGRFSMGICQPCVL